MVVHVFPQQEALLLGVKTATVEFHTLKSTATSVLYPRTRGDSFVTPEIMTTGHNRIKMLLMTQFQQQLKSNGGTKLQTKEPHEQVKGSKLVSSSPP